MLFVSAEKWWSSGWSGVALLLVVLLVACAVRTLNWAWLRPRRLDRALRAQGLTYRFLLGDRKEAARSNPMAPSHYIVPRIAPSHQRPIKEFDEPSRSFTCVSAASRSTWSLIHPILEAH
ncbi:hypothetical protein MUK42_08335 [Musa troglodytarum]|uniref:Cytochrome P450 n=1 Tax=Musa troglodytarum TaxID=320322 RepID=A0A9E7JXM0_9LILI|nr:hypothetical protein MUK42_08335 [Musa troglodytarum]